MTHRSGTPVVARPAVGVAPHWQFPQPVVSTLDSGLEVWAFDLPGQHVVAVDLQIDLPLDLEPRQAEGVASIALHTSDEGTVAHPGEQIAELLESAGAAFGGAVDHETTTCTLDVPSTRLAQALPLLAEIVVSPEHDEADISRHRALRLAQLEQIRAQGPASANQALRRVTWAAESRRSRPSGGLDDTVAALTPDAVRAFHAAHWRPAAARLFIGGDLSAHGDVRALVAESFAAWTTAGERPSPVDELPLVASGRRLVHLVDRPGAVQVDLRVSGTGVDRLDPDFAALQTASVAVGGSFMSRLNRVLREERGYTYGVTFGSFPHRRGGQWSLSGSFRTDAAVAALVEAGSLLDLSSTPLTDDETADARTQLVGLAPLRYDTPGSVLSQAGRLAHAGLGADHVNKHFANVAAVTSAQATDAFVRHVGIDAGHVVLVGDAAVLTPQLEAEGYEVHLLDLDER